MKYKPKFLRIPYSLIEDEQLKGADLKVFMAVYYFTQMKNKMCIASNDAIGEVAKVKSVQRSLLRLERRGYLKRYFKDAERKQRGEIKVLTRVQPTGHHIKKRNKEKNNSIKNEKSPQSSQDPKKEFEKLKAKLFNK